MRCALLWMAGIVLMPGSFAMQVTALHAQAAAAEKDMTGNWQGTLQGEPALRTILKISKDDGRLKGVMYSIDQGGQPIAVTTIALQANTLTFTIKPLELSYTGTLNPDGNTMAGSVTQHGHTNALNLEHVTAENTWAIPEPPKPMAPDAKPKFDVVTVKPSDPNRPGKFFGARGRHVITINTNLNDLITFAYNLHAKQLVNTPDWSSTEKFDLDGIPDVEGRPNTKQLKLLMQAALAERFKLTFHNDKKEMAVYALTVAKGGPKLTESAHSPTDPSGFIFRGLGDLIVTNETLKDFCDGMQGAVMDKPVVDQTGLTARYDFRLKWTPDDSQFAAFGPRPPAPATDNPDAPPALSTAMPEQVGLKLDPVRAPADVLVIDHVEKPSAN